MLLPWPFFSPPQRHSSTRHWPFALKHAHQTCIEGGSIDFVFLNWCATFFIASSLAQFPRFPERCTGSYNYPPTYLREHQHTCENTGRLHGGEPEVLPRIGLLRFDPSLLKEKTKNANTNQSLQLSTKILARIHLTQHQHPREPPRTATPRPSQGPRRAGVQFTSLSRT